jgi:hypothetical protein
MTRQKQSPELKRLYHRKTMVIRKALAYDILGNKCARCGFDDIRALQIDHINGNGKAERKLYKGGQTVLYRMVIESNGENYQLLCANCNWIKRVSEDEWSCVDPEIEYQKVLNDIGQLSINHRRRYFVLENFELAKDYMMKRIRMQKLRTEIS